MSEKRISQSEYDSEKNDKISDSKSQLEDREMDELRNNWDNIKKNKNGGMSMSMKWYDKFDIANQYNDGSS